MLETEYRKQQQKINDKRSWPLTITFSILALFPISGIVAVLEYVGNNMPLILTVIVPLALISLVLVGAAINGGRKVAVDAFDAVMSILFYWP